MVFLENIQMIADDDWLTLYNEGTALLELGLVDGAINALQQSISLKPYSPFSLRSLGDAYIYSNRLLEAEDCFRKAIDCGATLDGLCIVFAFFVDGVEYDNSGQYDKALVYYTMAIEENPYSPTPYSSRGIIYAKLKQFANALADFNKAIKLAPDDYKGYYNRGLYFTEIGRYHLALHDFSHALKLSSGDNEILLEYVEAIAILRQL